MTNEQWKIYKKYLDKKTESTKCVCCNKTIFKGEQNVTASITNGKTCVFMHNECLMRGL